MSQRHPAFRYANEAVGGVVLVVLLIVVAMLVQAGRLREWIDPGAEIKVLMPPDGLFGLSEGAVVEILGTEAGTVRRIVIDPRQQIYAEAYVRKGMLAFIRRDSQALIRKRFAVTGTSYLEITRGSGEPLDWDYAVIKATADRAPMEMVGDLIEELRSRALPIIDDTRRAIQAIIAVAENLQNPDGHLQGLLANLSAITGSLQQGEGSLGRLLVDDTLTRDAEALMAKLAPILGELEVAARNLAKLTTTINAQATKIPEITKRVQSILELVQGVLTDLRQTTPALPRLAKNTTEVTANLPLLMLQTEQTLSELEKLLQQLRSNWLLGGRSGGDRGAPERLPTLEVRP